MSDSPWDVAHSAADRAGVVLRVLDEPEDAERVRDLIAAVWGGQVMPPELIRALQHAGTILIGAERDRDMMGFVLGFPGFDPFLHVHSHMLGVLPASQSHGIGYSLKLAQRAACLDHGIDEVRWTFDPMVSRNAHFNLVKLGTEAIRFFPGFYGTMRDEINRGDRTDRFEVRWRLASRRVERALAGRAREPSPGKPLLRSGGRHPSVEPVGPLGVPGTGATVAVPREYHALRAADPELGRRWRDTAARAFELCFAAGLAATWITGDSLYVFEPAGGDLP